MKVENHNGVKPGNNKAIHLTEKVGKVSLFYFYAPTHIRRTGGISISISCSEFVNGENAINLISIDSVREAFKQAVIENPVSSEPVLRCSFAVCPESGRRHGSTTFSIEHMEKSETAESRIRGPLLEVARRVAKAIGSEAGKLSAMDARRS